MEEPHSRRLSANRTRPSLSSNRPAVVTLIRVAHRVDCLSAAEIRCNRRLEQSEDSVDIRAEQNERGGCDDIGLASVVTVDLDAPLGERQLVYDRTATTASLSPGMSVDGPLRVGAEFEVSFEGSLRRIRGGYFWIQELDGAPVALLRSDGNPEIPMSYNIDVAEAGMLDDGLSGESSMLALPPQIEPGLYHLCTANSPEDVCIEVDVRAT